MKKSASHNIKKILLTIIFAMASFGLQGCFSDKGGGAQNSILNLSPQQQLHGVIVSLETEKIIYDESKLNNNISVLERTLTSATGQTKYDMVFFNALYKSFYIDVLFKKGNFKVKQIQDMLKASELDIRYFAKAKYRVDEYHLILGLFNSIRNFMRSGEEQKRQVYKRARTHFSKLFRKDFFYTSDFKIGGVFLTQNDVRLFQIENEIRFEDPIEAYDLLKTLDKEAETFMETPQYKTKKAQLLVLSGQLEEAEKLLTDFKTRKYLRSPFYDEGVWILKGVFEMMLAADEKRSIDIKVANNLLKESGGFYGKGGVQKLADYLPRLSDVQKGLFKASYFYYNAKYDEAVDMLYDILDYPESRSHTFKKLDAEPDDLVKAHRILLRCYEHMKKVDEDRIKTETELAISPYDTEEVIIDLDILIKLEKKRRGELSETEEIELMDSSEVKLDTNEAKLKNTGKDTQDASEIKSEKKSDGKKADDKTLEASTHEVKTAAKKTAEVKLKTGGEDYKKRIQKLKEKIGTPKDGVITEATEEISLE